MESDPRDGDAGGGEEPNLVARRGLVRLQARHHDDLLLVLSLHRADGAQLAVGGVTAALEAAAAGQHLVVPWVLLQALLHGIRALAVGRLLAAASPPAGHILVPHQVYRRRMHAPLVGRHQQDEEQVVGGGYDVGALRRRSRVRALVAVAAMVRVRVRRDLLPRELDLELRVAIPRQARRARRGAAAAPDHGVRLSGGPLHILFRDELPGQPLGGPDLHDLHRAARLHQEPEAPLLAHGHGGHDEDGLQLLRLSVHLEGAVRDVLVGARGREHLEPWQQLGAAAGHGHILLVLHGVHLQRGRARTGLHSVDRHLDRATRRRLATRLVELLLVEDWSDEEVRVLSPGLRAEGSASVPLELPDDGGAPSPLVLHAWQVVTQPVLAAPLLGRLQGHAAVPVRKRRLVVASDAGSSPIFGDELQLPPPQLGVNAGEQVLRHECLPRVSQRQLQILKVALHPDLGHPLLGVKTSACLAPKEVLEPVGVSQHFVPHAPQRGLLHGEARLLEVAHAGRYLLGGRPSVSQRCLRVAHCELERLLCGQGEVHRVDLRERVP
mmetsp:Transcript_48824/g.136207  ORF Transcript_48824/g.136207 Transcript_48824/m.136207 type:complete len:552 (+) Transcript_48824:119-1774(+)